MRRRLVAALACALVVSGCGAASDGPRPARNVPGMSLARDRVTPAPTPSPRTTTPAETVVVEPRTDDSASHVRISSLGFDVPAGWSVERVDDAWGETRDLAPVGFGMALASVTTRAIAGEGDRAVESMLEPLAQLWQRYGPVQDVAVSWDPMPSARGFVVRYEVAPPGEGLYDLLAVAVHDRRETTVALVQVVAPAGTLQESVSFDVLRSVRWES